MASQKCPTCNAEPAVPANDNHLLLSGVDRQDLTLSEDSDCPDRLIWRRRSESFELALIKNADGTRPLLNRVAGPDSRLHLDPAHKEGYYLFGKNLFEIFDSICDGYRWNEEEVLFNSDGPRFYTALGDTPVHRYVTVVPNPCWYVEGRVPQLVGCYIVHLRYTHVEADPDVHPPAIEGIVLNPRLALEDISKFDLDRPSHCDELPELHLRSVLGCYWDFSDAYSRHALPGSSYLVDVCAFRRWTMASDYKFFKISDHCSGSQTFESNDPITVAGLVGFVLAPYCQALARVAPLTLKPLTFRKLLKNPAAAAKLSYLQFFARCVKCPWQDFIDIHALIHHLCLCFDVDFVAALYSRNCPK